MGKPTEETRFLQKGARAASGGGGGSSISFSSSSVKGMMARTADPQMQRQQMLAVVQKATTDLAAVMQGFDSGKEKSKAPARLEDVVRGINGDSETISVEDITLMEQAVVETTRAAQISSTEEPCPVEPSAALLSSLQTLGCASTMVPEDRLVAQ